MAHQTEHTYMRDAVPAEKTGQCPCCLRPIRASNSAGHLARHGWQERGRRVGQHGCGFQWGECIGSDARPLEQTDADALVILVKLATHLADVRASLVEHAAGKRPSYTTLVHVATGPWHERSDLGREVYEARLQPFLKGLKRAGLTAGATTFDPASSLRSAEARVLVTVPQGSKGMVMEGRTAYPDDLSRSGCSVTVPGYEKLRLIAKHDAEQLIQRLERQEKDIKAAIEHHRANPTNGAEDTVRRGPAVHLEREVAYYGTPRKVRACGARRSTRGRNPTSTTDPTKVTCTKCKKAMA